MAALLVKVPHTDFSEVSRMVLVKIGTVMVLATSHTTTTGICVSRALSSAPGLLFFFFFFFPWAIIEM